MGNTVGGEKNRLTTRRRMIHENRQRTLVVVEDVFLMGVAVRIFTINLQYEMTEIIS